MPPFRRCLIAPLAACLGLGLSAQGLPPNLQDALQAYQAGQQQAPAPAAPVPAAPDAATPPSEAPQIPAGLDAQGQALLLQAQAQKELAKQIEKLRSAYKGPF